MALAVTLPVLAWLWMAAPPAALPATAASVLFIFAEARRLRMAGGFAALRLEPDGVLAAEAGGAGTWRMAGRPVVLPWAVIGRMTHEAGPAVPVAVTPASAGEESFRRLLVLLREAARREGAPGHGVSQAR